jgi:hypothetical protein
MRGYPNKPQAKDTLSPISLLAPGVGALSIFLWSSAGALNLRDIPRLAAVLAGGVLLYFIFKTWSRHLAYASLVKWVTEEWRKAQPEKKDLIRVEFQAWIDQPPFYTAWTPSGYRSVAPIIGLGVALSVLWISIGLSGTPWIQSWALPQSVAQGLLLAVAVSSGVTFTGVYLLQQRALLRDAGLWRQIVFMQLSSIKPKDAVQAAPESWNSII